VSEFPGILFTLIGPAGAGKNTVMKEALARISGARQFPTVTTRAPRPGEMEGREHYFVDHTEFERMDRAGELLESQDNHGQWYGMPRRPLEAGLTDGAVFLADIDMRGALCARETFPDNVVLVFIQPPSLSALIARMRERGSETEAQIGKRLLRAPLEMDFAPQCDYLITNDTLDQAVNQLVSVIHAERSRRAARRLIGTAPRPRQYSARVIIARDGDLLVSETSGCLPAAEFPIESQPHVAALEAARTATASDVSAAQLTTRDAAQNGYVPPVYVADDSDAQTDRFIYYYAVTPDPLWTNAPGWAWRPAAAVDLPQPVRTVMMPESAV
jgi:guanylate kinase